LFNTFIKSSVFDNIKYNNNLISPVWPEKAVFVDWLNDKCLNIVQYGLDDLYPLLNFDGLWIDMNEATTFQSGEINGDDPVPPPPNMTLSEP
jgi:alpha-D-xyloside xylohydrolase